MSIYSSLLEQANDARTRIREASAEEAGQPGDNGTVFLDVREVAEFRAGHIPGGILLSRGELEDRIAEIVPDKNTPIVVYCAIGHRSAIAADTLQALGYRQVVSLKGGLQEYQLLNASLEAA